MSRIKVKDLKYIRKDKLVAYYIQNKCDQLEFATKMMRSLENINELTCDTIFTMKDSFHYNNNHYIVIQCEHGVFVTRIDNIKIVFENKLEEFGISKLISSGNKTILVTQDNKRYMTTRADIDEEDMEKAVMLLLLKKHGYSYNDIKDLVDCIDYQ